LKIFDEQVQSSAIIHCTYNLIGIRPIRSSFGTSSALYLRLATNRLESLSSPGEGIVKITLLTQVKKKRKEFPSGASNLDPVTRSPIVHRKECEDKG